MRLFLEHGASLEATDNQQSTPLYLAAGNRQVAAAQLLVDHGAPLGDQSNLGRTSLHDTSWYGYTDIMRLFPWHSARLEARDITFKTLHYI